MRLVVADTKKGKTYQTELPKEMEGNILGKKIGEEIDGNLVGVPGYKLQLTGGSDKSGFPMRKDITGQRKAYVLLSGGTGFNPRKKGQRRRKLVRGNTYSLEIMQVNSIVISGEGKPLEEMFPKKEDKK